MKELPVLFQSKEECCGCSACMAVCPKNAITMVRDEQGFLYPSVCGELCCRCYQCVSVCDFKTDSDER